MEEKRRVTTVESKSSIDGHQKRKKFSPTLLDFNPYLRYHRTTLLLLLSSMEITSPPETSECAGLGPTEKEPQRRFFDYSGPVESISLDGATVNWYTNVVEAATKTEVFEKGIKRCMKGDRITYGGLKWRRGAPQVIEEETNGGMSAGNNPLVESKADALEEAAPAAITIEASQPLLFKTGVSIECMTQDGIVLHRFLDIKSIRKQANFTIERIQTVLRKQQQKSAGFYWRFYDENRVNDSSHLISLEELLSYKETSSDYKLLFPSHKKMKTKYDDVSTSVVSSGRSSFTSIDNSFALKEIISENSVENGKDDKSCDQDSDIFVSHDSLDPLPSFNSTIVLDFNRDHSRPQQLEFAIFKERIHEPL